MAKKSFKDSARQSVASAFFSDTDDKDTEDVQDIQDTKSVLPENNTAQDAAGSAVLSGNGMTGKKDASLPPYRINLKLRGEYKEYLDQVSWENRMSITQYLNGLIEEDKKRYEKSKK